jgi:hypothetical protein
MAFSWSTTHEKQQKNHFAMFERSHPRSGERGFGLGFKGFDWKGSYDKCPLNFFTNDSNIILGISSLIYIIAALVSFKKDSFPKAVTLIRLIGSTATLVTFIVVVTILGPQYGFMKFVFGIEGGFLFLHFICPLLSLISFVFFESENRLGFWNSIYTMIPTILYGCVWIVLELINTKYQDIAPYPFLEDLWGACLSADSLRPRDVPRDLGFRNSSLGAP